MHREGTLFKIIKSSYLLQYFNYKVTNGLLHDEMVLAMDLGITYTENILTVLSTAFGSVMFLTVI